MEHLQQTISSLEVSEMIEKEHKNLIRSIETHIEHFTELKIEPSEYFVESTYKDSSGKTNKCYKVTKKGCELIAHKLTGIKGTAFTVKYINRFHDMEEAIKQNTFDTSQLSQELQMFLKMGEAMAKQELEQKRQAEQLNRIEEKQNILQETFRKSADKDKFKEWCRKCISKIVKSPSFAFGISKSEKYALAWDESYKRLNEERSCRLKQRVETAQKKAMENGATYSQAKEINQLTIIANDKDLKPVYEMVIKEMMACYCMD